MRDLVPPALRPSTTEGESEMGAGNVRFVVDGIQRDFLLRPSNHAATAAPAQSQSTNLSRSKNATGGRELFHFHESVAAIREACPESCNTLIASVCPCTRNKCLQRRDGRTDLICE